MYSKILSALAASVCAVLLMLTCTASTRLPYYEPAVPTVTEPEPAAPPPLLPYDFSLPVPESQPVEIEYFADAAFVGDSRTDGFCLFSGAGGDNLTSTGLSVFTLETKKAIRTDAGTLTVLEALERKQYGKVYLNLGVNELGYNNDDSFYRAYCAAIDSIRARQPDAVIYVQTLIPLNEGRVRASGGASYLKNEKLLRYNNLICRVAQEKRVPLLDLYSEFAVDGQLPEDFSRDGIHLTAAHYAIQLEHFKTHTVTHEQLNATPQPTEVLS